MYINFNNNISKDTFALFPSAFIFYIVLFIFIVGKIDY